MELSARIFSFMTAFAVAIAVMAPSASADDPSFISVGIGWYDINDDQSAVDLRVEYRSKAKFLGFVKPWVGVELTSDIAAYGVAGVFTDFFFGRRFVLTPSFGIGVYADGDGKDLGSAIEFRHNARIRLSDVWSWGQSGHDLGSSVHRSINNTRNQHGSAVTLESSAQGYAILDR